MKKGSTRVMSVFLVLVLLLSAAPLAGLADFDFSSVKAKAVAKTWAVGDIGYMGTYPQIRVTDTDLLSKLNAQTLNWVSYGYYSGNCDNDSMTPGDWMKYADVLFGGNKYRAVSFTSYRPDQTQNDSDLDYTFQDDNGYTTGKTYWFKFEPIAWKVLDPSAGLVMSDMILDSQAYSNTMYDSGSYCYNNSACTVYANDYVTSSIRKWLNDDFYNTAFSSDEQTVIQSTTLDNRDCDPSDSIQYDSASTSDKIFLLSYADAHNSSYGFDSGKDASPTRCAKGTDYAKSQGLWVYSGNSCWRLRTPGYSAPHACEVFSSGNLYRQNFFVCETAYGVRAAFKTDLQSSIFKSEKPETVCTEHVYGNFISNNDGTHTRTCAVCGAVETADCSYTDMVTPPACTSQGYTTHTCSVCGDSYVDTYTDALGHDYQAVVTPPACTEQGYTTHTCSLCGDSHTDNYVPALGHVDEDGDGLCDVCGEPTGAVVNTGATWFDSLIRLINAVSLLLQSLVLIYNRLVGSSAGI